MTFCREFGGLPEAGGYFDQPADVIVRWQDYATIEAEANEMKRKIDEAQAKARQH
jgi:hypothetical protein